MSRVDGIFLFAQGMDPIFCTSFIDGITPDIYNYCILKIGSAYGLPLLNHFGTGYSPQYCQW